MFRVVHIYAGSSGRSGFRQPSFPTALQRANEQRVGCGSGSGWVWGRGEGAATLGCCMVSCIVMGMGLGPFSFTDELCL